VTAATSAGFPVRLFGTDNLLLESKGGRGDIRSFLDHLAGVECERGAGFLNLSDHLQHRHAASTLIVVTGLLGEDDLAAVRRTALNYDRAVLVRLRPDGMEPPSVGTELTPIDAATAADACLRWNIFVRGGR
jgi:hypothetical protein